MFRAHVFIVRRAKLYYKVSGIITPIGGRPVHGTATYRRTVSKIFKKKNCVFSVDTCFKSETYVWLSRQVVVV